MTEEEDARLLVEEALPRLEECHLEEVSKLYKAKQEKGVMASTLRSP